MYEQLLAEAMHADRMAELDQIRFALEARRLADGVATIESLAAPAFWQRSLAAVRRTPARSLD